MLTADQIEVLGEQARQITDPIVEFLIQDIARRVSEAGQLTATAAYQTWRLQQLGFSQRQLKKELRKRLKVSHRELRKLLTQAAEVGYDFDIRHLPYVQAVPFKSNEVVQSIVEAMVDMARSDLTNMVETLGFVNHDGVCRPLTEAYENACDFAFKKVAFGAQDYNSAVRGAVRELAAKGIQTIDYESGVHTSLEAAVRRNVMGGLGLMQERISQQNHDDLGCDGWEISAHEASAPDHEPIQGKQYSDAQYTALNNSLVRRIGTLNCGHAAFPIILGVSSPQYTPEQLEAMRRRNEEGVTIDGKHYTLYGATQHQRDIERAIRKRKKKILLDEGLHDEQRLAQDQTKLVRLNEEYARFTKAAGLRSQRERTMVAGFGKKQATAARKAASSMNQFDSQHLAKDTSELLPGYDRAVIPDGKLTGYVLNMEHPVGKNKALVFEKVLGYNIGNKDMLIDRVYAGLKKYRANARKPTQYGQPFEVLMMLEGVNGKFTPVKTAWQIDSGSDFPRLVSMYVDEMKKE